MGKSLFPKFLLFLPVSGEAGKVRGEATPSIPPAVVHGDGEQPPSVILMSRMWFPDMEHVLRLLLKCFFLNLNFNFFQVVLIVM